MESVKMKNGVLRAVWCIVLTIAGISIAVTVNADTYLEHYYDVFWYMIVEIALTVTVVLLTAIWWHLASSENVGVQRTRMWISNHGTIANLLSSFPVWLAAGIAHVICSTALTRGNSGYRIFSVFVLPFLYMGLSYLLPPVEISETILPGGGIGQKIARGVLVVAFLGVIGLIVYNDFFY